MAVTTLKGKILFITVFSIAMAFLESAVVVYLRELYYPGGFAFPLKIMAPILAQTEILREAATMVMLLSIAFILGRRPVEIFAVFLLAFGIWDLFYYIFLRCLIDWPSSLLTWDILFLIPVMWVGPVAGPVINSLTMIAIAWLIMRSAHKGIPCSLKAWEWTLLITGALLVFISYTEEFTHYVWENRLPGEGLFPMGRDRLTLLSTSFVPQHFQWAWYITGVIMHLAAILMYGVRMNRGCTVADR